MLSPCVVRFALSNGSDVYFLQMVLGVFRFLLHIETSEFNGLHDTHLLDKIQLRILYNYFFNYLATYISLNAQVYFKK